MMKQLDFFFDKILGNSLPNKSTESKTLVFGGKKNADDVIFVFGKKVRIKRKAYQRNLSMSLKPNGELSVIAARTIPLKMITRFVTSNWSWIEAQSAKFAELKVKYPKKHFEPGEQFPILGMEHALKIAISKSKRPSVNHMDGSLIVEIQEKYLLNRESALGQVKYLVRAYYEEIGKKVLAERVFLLSKQLGLYPQSVSYRAQKTRWGSCSAAGGISLNWRLVAAPIDVIDYVVIHELCHLKHHNHSKAFWKLVEEHCPKWQKTRRWLRENQYAFDFLNDVSEIYV